MKRLSFIDVANASCSIHRQTPQPQKALIASSWPSAGVAAQEIRPEKAH
jgi:hypothetical protein